MRIRFDEDKCRPYNSIVFLINVNELGIVRHLKTGFTVLHSHF
jgi:hypothetical protein